MFHATDFTTRADETCIQPKGQPVLTGNKNSTDNNRKRFENLAYPHMDALFNTALRLTRNQLDAEDLLQEVYLRAFRFFEKFEEGTNFKAWIFKILTNTFINSYRQKARTPQHLEFENNVEHFYAEPERSRESRLQHEGMGYEYADLFGDEVNTALQKLSDGFRLVVILCDVEEFAYKEIAEILGIPMGTVMSRLSRARGQLQKYLRDYAVQEGYIKKKDVAN